MSDINPEWEREVQEQCIDPMRNSAIVATIFSGAVDWKIAIEIGAAVLLDKPVVLCVSDETVAVPKHLAKIADKVLVLTDPDFQEQLSAVIEGLHP